MKVLIEVNVALDVILERPTLARGFQGVWDACHETRFAGRPDRDRRDQHLLHFATADRD